MRRSPLITLLALAILALAAYNLLGVLDGVQRYTVLHALPLAVSPLYLVASRAVWAVILGGFAWGLWRRREWARRGLLLALALYVAQGWFDRLVLARSDFARTTLPYHLGLHLLVLAGVAGLLWWRPTRRAFAA